MIKLYLLFIVFFFLSGCSTSYVLHTHPRGKFLNSRKESTPITVVDDVALLYDREQWVLFEPPLEDGSTWIHYAVAVKNASPNKISIQTSQVRLEDKDKNKVIAVLDAEDIKTKEFGMVSPKTYYRFAVKFHLPTQIARNYGGSSEALWLVVPLGSGKELRQKVWLWKE